MAKETYNFTIHLGVHSLEQIKGGDLVDNERIFLFKISCLYTLFKIIHCSEMFFPGVIYYSKSDLSLKRINQFAALSVEGFVEVCQHLDNLFTICEWYHYIFNIRTLGLADVFEYRHSLRMKIFHLQLIVCNSF